MAPGARPLTLPQLDELRNLLRWHETAWDHEHGDRLADINDQLCDWLLAHAYELEYHARRALTVLPFADPVRTQPEGGTT